MGMDQELYTASSAIITSVRNFCQQHIINEILPSPIAPRLEFPVEKSFFIGNEEFPELILPASNSFQKQLASQYLGNVFCIAPCYRREQQLIPRSLLHKIVFHQIEIELKQASMSTAMDYAQLLLQFIISEFPIELRKIDNNIFSKINTIDLSQQDNLLHSINSYDEWASNISGEIACPHWIIHTPQTILPCLNKNYGEKLSLGFDMILPFGFGELISGGERDKSQLMNFYGKDFQIDTNNKSSGFGVGFERLIAFILQIPYLKVITLPHHRGSD